MLNKLIHDFLPINLREMRYPGFDKKRAQEIARCVDNVRKGKGTRKVEWCPLCGSPESNIVFSRFGINIRQCEACTVGYSEEFPIDINDVYSSADYLPIATSDYLENVKYRKERFGCERLSLIASCLGREPAGMRLLDIGCGTGWFLECARDAGYEVAGQELGRELAAFTASRLGVEVWSDPVTELPADHPYDVVTMFDVLEHVANPKEVLAHIFTLLKQGGIALFFVPNFDSVALKILKSESTLCMPVEHLFYFTEASLRPVFEGLGFDVVDFATKGMDIADLYSYYRDVLGRSESARLLEELVDVLQPVIDAAECGNHMRFVVRKP